MLKKLVRYFQESRQELERVSWPNRQETARLTAIVVAVTLGVGAYLGVLDYLYSQIVEFILAVAS